MMGDDLARSDRGEPETSDSALEWVISGLVALVAVGGVIAVATALLLFFPGSNGLDAAEVQEILEEQSELPAVTTAAPSTDALVVSTIVDETSTTIDGDTTSAVSVLAGDVAAPPARVVPFRVVPRDTPSLIGRA